MPEDLFENRTKHSLDGALRELLTRKPLDQIRVREVTDLCAIRRQSFYYHFPDIYALFDWSLRQEAARLCRRQENCLTWQQALLDLLVCTKEQRSYYMALLENRGRSGLRTVFQDAVDQLLEQTLAYYLQRCGTPRDPAAEQTRLAYWKTILLSLLEGWICGDLRQSPEELIGLMESSVQRENLGAVWQNLPQWEGLN